MKTNPVLPYLLNCFLLTLPVMAWDLILTDKLPSAYQPGVFWKDIPAWLTYGENISRTLVFALALLMPLQIRTSFQKKGLMLYLSGLLLYFAAWLAILYSPGSAWSVSPAGFMAPAYTPLCWLMGIAFTGDRFYFGLPYRRWFFILICLVFLIFHNMHTWLVFGRVY